MLFIFLPTGCQHDPVTDECAPSSSDGGKFIMYTYSVNGYEADHRVRDSVLIDENYR